MHTSPVARKESAGRIPGGSTVHRKHAGSCIFTSPEYGHKNHGLLPGYCRFARHYHEGERTDFILFPKYLFLLCFNSLDDSIEADRHRLTGLEFTCGISGFGRQRLGAGGTIAKRQGNVRSR